MFRIILFMSSLALATVAISAEAGRPAPQAPRETKDRLPPEKMEAMVAGPLRAAEAGDVAKARRAFDRLVERARLRHGGASVREADLLTAFGVQLYDLGGDLDREDLRRLALTYLALAVDASKRAFGPRHPETALALHSYADVLVALADGAPPEAAETAFVEALSIRQAALGSDNAETLAAMRALARTKAARFREPGKIDEAAELFRRAIGISTRMPQVEGFLSPANLRLDLVSAYVDAGRIDDSLREARIAAQEAAREEANSNDLPCSFAVDRVLAIAAALQAERPADAETLRALFAPRVGCLDALIDDLEQGLTVSE